MSSLNFFEKRKFLYNVDFSLIFVWRNFKHITESALIVYVPLILFLWIINVINEEWYRIITFGNSKLLYDVIKSEIYDNAQVTIPFHYWVFSLIYQIVVTTLTSSVFYNHFMLYSSKSYSFRIKELRIEMSKTIWTLMGTNTIISITLFVTVFFFTRIIMLSFLADSLFITYFIGFVTLSIILYFIIRLIFIQVITVVEQTNLIASIERSTELVKENWWNILGVFVVFTIGGVLFTFLYVLFASVLPTTLVYILSFVFIFLGMVLWKTCIFAMYASLHEEKENKALYKSISKLGYKEKEEDNEDF